MKEDNRPKYTAALKVDILSMLDKSEIGVFELRRISDIALLAERLMGSTDRFEETEAVKGILLATEVKAPTLHAVILDNAFDAQALLREKYQRLNEQQHQLKVAKLNIEQAADQIKLEQHRLQAHESALKLHARHLERERERLQLTAAASGVNIHLPELPALTNPDTDEEHPSTEHEPYPASGSQPQEAPKGQSTRDNY